MKHKQLNSNKLDYQLELDDGGSIARLKTVFLPDGAYRFEDELEVNGTLAATVITCAAWLLEVYELEAGELFFIRGEEHIYPHTKRFGVFYPPFTITRACFRHAKGHLTGVGATESLAVEFMSVPTVFEVAFAGAPTGVAQVKEILQSGCNRQSIESNPKASLLSRKTKKLIDENYSVYPSIARIAARLGVTHEHLSRQFKRDFGLSPSAYLHRLRVADATFRLAKGEEIIGISYTVGYNDLSRFYKQFRKSTKTSPSSCRAMVKPKQVS